MRQYLQAFKYGAADALTYRARMFVWFLQSTVSICVLPFIWLTIYGNQDDIAGYSKIMMISYFFFVPIIDSITCFHVNYEIQQDIRNGGIVNFLIKPIKYLVYQFYAEIGYKCIGIFPSLCTMILLYPFVKSFIALPSFSWYLLWIFPVLICGVFIGFLVSSLIGLVAFWTTRAEWASHLWWMISTFVGGFIGPLEFFPLPIQNIIAHTPFPLLINTPISILLGTMSQNEIVRQIGIGSIWILGLGGLNAFLYWRGTKRIDGIGI